MSCSCIKYAYTRLCLYQGNAAHISGVVHIKPSLLLGIRPSVATLLFVSCPLFGIPKERYTVYVCALLCWTYMVRTENSLAIRCHTYHVVSRGILVQAWNNIKHSTVANSWCVAMFLPDVYSTQPANMRSLIWQPDLAYSITPSSATHRPTGFQKADYRV